MFQNMGFADRVSRVGFAVVLAGVALFSGLPEIWYFVVALAATGLLGFCPIYVPFGFDSLETDEPEVTVPLRARQSA